MNSSNEKVNAVISRLTKSGLSVFVSLLIIGVILKLMYILAAPIWRVDLYYHIQSAKTILDGGVLFRDFGNSHPAGIVFIHWSLMKLFGYENITVSLKAAALMSQTGAAYFIYRIIQKGYTDFMGFICSVIFIVALTINWQLWPANIMFFYLLPAMAGTYCIYKNIEKQALFPYFAGGLLFSISALICTNTIFYTLLVPMISYYSNRDIKKFFLHSIAGFAGFMIPAAINFGYFYYHNALSDYYRWNILWASIYASYKPFYMKFLSIFTGMGKTWEWIPLYIFSFYGIYILLKQRLYRNNSAAFLALAVSFVSVISRLAMERSVIRYSLYLLPGLVILLPAAFRQFGLITGVRLKKYITVSTAAFILVVFCFTNYTAYSVSRTFAGHNRKELHQWIKDNTKSDDSIFVWYEGYELYFYSGRKMATSMFSTAEFLDHVGVWKANKYRDIDIFWGRFIDEFKRDRPRLLIDIRPDFELDNNWERDGDMKKYFDIFKQYLDQNYMPVTVVDGAKIWKRID